MTDHEQPTEGGSFRREKDGSLTRIESEASQPAADAPAETAKAGGRATKKEK
jgi:hypothetical protein